MPVSRNQAIVSALASRAYPVGMCARWTRERFGLPALGDFDRDGDADAVDMWKASVLKNAGDRNPPAGVPVFWSGGSNGHGHAAISLGDGFVRTIDRPVAGTVSTVPLGEIERAWGLKYLGWTIDLYGHEIPDYDAERAVLQKRIDRKVARRAAIKATRVALAAELAKLRDVFRGLPR
jgi:hypothetical protein